MAEDVAKAVKAKRPTWGYANSPVIINDALLVNVGTRHLLDKNTGDIIWQTGGAPGYSSMVPYVRDGQHGWCCSRRRKLWRLIPKPAEALGLPVGNKVRR